jgi:hypothetical protein
MGGFVSSLGSLVVIKEQLEDSVLGPELQEAVQNIDAEDIMDKSKGDALSKGVAPTLQGMWFTAQCLVRVHQHLVVNPTGDHHAGVRRGPHIHLGALVASLSMSNAQS